MQDGLNLDGVNVDVYDLDHTLFNTEHLWFGPVIDAVARLVKRDRSYVDAKFVEVCAITFTFENFFRAAELPATEWKRREAEFREGLALRAQACLYPGILPLLYDRVLEARPVLVTAGDPEWQRWKFDQLHCLHPIFAPEDRHFVPMAGSKADVIGRYRGASRLTFVDDSTRWHREVACIPNMTIHQIRPIWPDTLGAGSHKDDGVAWTAVRTIEELTAALNS